MHTDRFFLTTAATVGATAVVGSADTADAIRGEVPCAHREGDAQ